jgi:hypothetical protein
MTSSPCSANEIASPEVKLPLDMIVQAHRSTVGALRKRRGAREPRGVVPKTVVLRRMGACWVSRPTDLAWTWIAYRAGKIVGVDGTTDPALVKSGRGGTLINQKGCPAAPPNGPPRTGSLGHQAGLIRDLLPPLGWLSLGVDPPVLVRGLTQQRRDHDVLGKVSKSDCQPRIPTHRPKDRRK